jgi:choline monooxygenase
MKSQNLDELSRIVDLDKIESAKNSINEANGLPNECYLNDEYFKIEREKSFL